MPREHPPAIYSEIRNDEKYCNNYNHDGEKREDIGIRWWIGQERV